MRKVLMVANWDWVLRNYRLSLAEALRERGYDVQFVCPPGNYVDELEEGGFDWIPWSVGRRSVNPFTELKAIWKLAAIYRRVGPDIVHHDTIKPNVYGGLAIQMNAAGSRARPRVVNSLMGTGFVFSQDRRARVLRQVAVPLLRTAMKSRSVVTFSNQGDLEAFKKRGIVDGRRSAVMVSEYVDTETFAPRDASAHTEDAEQVVVLLGARLLWDKGVRAFVQAARTLEQKNNVRFWLAGTPDEGNPGAVPEQQLRAWDDEGAVRWLGHRSDMPDLLREVDIAALPTHYNEGLPRFLVEAAATGLPLVATDIPACRRVVRDGENGVVIPVQSGEALARAVGRLAEDPALRREMGAASRRTAVDEFSERANLGKWLALYEELPAQ